MANIIFPRGFVHKYPYSDFHELNLDWILETVQKMSITVEEFINEYGTPTAVENASEMKNPNKIYVYVGETNPQFIYGHWYFYDTETNLWSDGGKYGALDIDASFDINSRNAVENKAITRKFELVDASVYGLTSQVSNLSRDFNSFETATNNKFTLVDASVVNHEERINTLENIKLTGTIIIATAGDRTIPGTGFISITDIKPSGTILGAWVRTYSDISPVSAINITGDGNFLFGAPNTTVSGLQIAFLVA